MLLTTRDWGIVAASIITSSLPAVLLVRRAGSSTAELFTSGWAAPLLASLSGCAAIYSALFGSGAWLYGHYPKAVIFSAVAAIGAVGVGRLLPRVLASNSSQ